ncbi:MAG: ferredoxin domain-containing protein [Candidatus Bathyarchaeia archaeon]|jgi:uncharacterized ferredoxin-like protein|nr:hypothetical protein [Candidatus Bathyarchaeota archaeon A05DMB-4]MDH7595903.1 DUF2148 domain-containing protein [Candidatus Bathyarchaeota archaeon]
MPVIGSVEGEKDALLHAAGLMLISVRTAPKSAGIDDVLAAVVYGKEKDAIVAEMEKIAEERKIWGFHRDSQNLRDSEAVLLVGVKGTKKFGLNCGACGYATCDEFERVVKTKVGLDFVGPNCVFKLLDLGIALGSAVKTASVLNVDNRIMYRIGTAAKRLNLLPEASVIMGVPLSVKGKSIYFDRSTKP